MIRFVIKKRNVVLEYVPEFSEDSWVLKELKEHHEVTISKVFTFRKGDLISDSDQVNGEPVFRFRFASRSGGYFRISGRKLRITNDVLIADKGVKFERKIFVAERHIGVFRRIAK